MSGTAAIWWVRLDLRLADNPALHAAMQCGAVVPVFIHCPEEEAPWPPGAASNWWLHQSLSALEARLKKAGSHLVIRRGDSLGELCRLVEETGARGVFWNRRYDPACIARDRTIKAELRARGLEAGSFNAALLHEPWTIRNQSGKPFRVFTPFWRHCLAQPDPAALLPAPRRFPPPPRWPESLALGKLTLEPRLNWADGFHRVWQPGEAGARAALERFLAHGFPGYTEQRHRPDRAGTSRLSPHLHFGEISACQVWHGLKAAAGKRRPPGSDWRGSQFLAELGWREFSHHLLFHFPHAADQPLRREFDRFPWRENKRFLRAWQRGATGYPIVDAGMRELWASGWMHNRVRMIAASFLVKDLLQPWQAGARWFWDTLVDADLPQNSLGWQWTAGCGADAAPFFRVFNPTTQGEKFDPDGDYVRRWCPELAGLPAKWIHRPDQAPADVLLAAGVKLGRTYPPPLLSHATARMVALGAFASLKSADA